MKPFFPSVAAVIVFGVTLTGCSGTGIAPATSEKPESAARLPAKRVTDPRTMTTTVRLWLT